MAVARSPTLGSCHKCLKNLDGRSTPVSCTKCSKTAHKTCVPKGINFDDYECLTCGNLEDKKYGDGGGVKVPATKCNSGLSHDQPTAPGIDVTELLQEIRAEIKNLSTKLDKQNL